MKYKAYARMYEIHAFVLVFGLPFLIVTFAGLSERGWTKYIFLAHAVIILLFFFRAGWMAFLRSKFPHLNLYAIRMALGGHLLSSAVIIEDSINGVHGSYTAFGKVALVPAIFLIFGAMLGTLTQAFIDSIRALMKPKEK